MNRNRRIDVLLLDQIDAGCGDDTARKRKFSGTIQPDRPDLCGPESL